MSFQVALLEVYLLKGSKEEVMSYLDGLDGPEEVFIHAKAFKEEGNSLFKLGLFNEAIDKYV